MPDTVPDGSADTASFAASDVTDISLTGNIEVSSIHFNTGAAPFTINVDTQAFLNLTGAGIVNDSGAIQSFTGSFADFHAITPPRPISGVFANLPDGSTLTAGSNTLQVSYTGGDGNDLTLTVVR